MKPDPLRALEKLRNVFHKTSGREKRIHMRRLARTRLRSAAEVERLHEILCFVRAYPDDARTLAAASRMLRAFLAGLAAHLEPGGEGWLVLSDIAEHLGLRTRDDFLAAIDQAGLKVVGRTERRPKHPKALDPTDPLHTARAAEMTSLWRLAVR